MVTGVGAAGSRSGGIGVWGYPNPDAGYGTALISGNTFDNTRGVRIYDTKVATVSNNFFVDTDNGVTLYDLGYGVTDISDIHINNNSFEGTFGSAIHNTAFASPVDAQTNWFGTSDAAAIAALVSGNVDYSPWLESGTDTFGDAGFQGDLGALRVGLGGAHIGSAGRIQDGVNLVTAGGTVTVNDGTYVENVTVNKSVNLLSVNGRDFTTIEGVAGPEQGSVYITAGVNDVTIGGATGNGFEIIGIDGAAASEKSAIYLQGAHSNLQILSNNVVANGDGGLTSEFGLSLTNVLIDNNIFSGQTFNGTNPAGEGFGAQFSLF